VILFNSDLDNTLIYSYKHEIGVAKRCVEIYQGREISFMTEKSYQLLLKISEKVLFVPTTTRTVEQYNRIKFENLMPHYALVCNGGVLLIDGEEDGDWFNGSLSLIKDSETQLKKAESYLKSDENITFEIRNIKELFIFTKSSHPLETLQNLENRLDTTKVDVLNIGEKIYVIPKKLNKGTSVERLKKKLNPTKTIAAGDSDFDVPMLEIADIALAPCGLNVKAVLEKSVKFFDNDRIFSDDLLEFIQGI